MFANALYFSHVNKKVARLQATTTDPETLLRRIAGSGGTSEIALAIAIVLGSLAIISILAAVALPAYQSYIQTANSLRVQNNYEQGAQYVEDSLRRTKASISLGAANLQDQPSANTLIEALNEEGATSPEQTAAFSHRADARQGQIGIEVYSRGSQDYTVVISQPAYGDLAEDSVVIRWREL